MGKKRHCFKKKTWREGGKGEKVLVLVFPLRSRAVLQYSVVSSLKQLESVCISAVFALCDAE